MNFELDGLTLKYASAQPGVDPEFAFATEEVAEVNGTVHRWESAGELTVLGGVQPGPECVLELRGTAGQHVRIGGGASQAGPRRSG